MINIKHVLRLLPYDQDYCIYIEEYCIEKLIFCSYGHDYTSKDVMKYKDYDVAVIEANKENVMIKIKEVKS